MDELIRKQDALDAFNGNVTISAPRNAGRVYTYLKMVTDRIKALPPVQPEILASGEGELNVPDTDVEDMISRQAATTIPVMPKEHRHYQTNNLDDAYEQGWNDLQECIENLPTVQPERLTDDDFETIRIHLNAYKEKLCNQHRWEEAEEYQRIIDRFVVFASAHQKHGEWEYHSNPTIGINPEDAYCSCCGFHVDTTGNIDFDEYNFCPHCAADMRGTGWIRPKSLKG